MKKEAREPLVRIARRESMPLWKAWAIRLLGLLIAFVVCAIVIFAMVRLNPLNVYGAMWKGAFGTPRRGWITMRDTMMLLCIAVGSLLALPSAGFTTCLIGSPYFVANSWSRSSCAGTAITAPVP